MAKGQKGLEWKGTRHYKGKGRMAPGPAVKIKTRLPLNAEAPVQVVQAFVSAMNGLVPKVPTNIDELYAALAVKYGSKTKAAEAYARAQGKLGEGLTAKEMKSKIASQRREFERYIIAEDAKGAKGGSQARGTKLENREAFRLKVQQFYAPTFARDRDAAIAEKGVWVDMQGTLRIARGDENYFERRQIRMWIPGHYWRATSAKGRRMGILDAWDKGWTKGATIRFQRAFAEVYEMPDSSWAYMEELTFEPPN